MEESEPPESWEIIESSFPAKQRNLVVITDNYFHHESAVFPPSRHEDLEAAPEDAQSPDETSSSPSSASHSEAGFGSSKRPAISEWRIRIVAGITRCWRLSYEAVQVKVVSRFCELGLSAASLWPVLPVAATAAFLLSLFYWKIQLSWRRKDSRDRLLSLDREKDEKISQLLLQIAQMNEMLSARRRVPVLRIK